MQPIRVLIVDDSVVIRHIISSALSKDPEIEIAGTASNGNLALIEIEQVKPDIVILDIEMPEKSGLEVLPELRKKYPRLPVIMFSTLTERGAISTLDALSYGANDYVTKPSNLKIGDNELAVNLIKNELIPKIKALGVRKILFNTSLPNPKPREFIGSPSGIEKINILAIGISTGGPNALAEFLPSIPPNFPVPIVIVQHMPPIFTKLLAERLSSKSSIKVFEASPGDELLPGYAWIAPGNYHMTLERNGNRVKIQTNQGSLENSCRPSVDVLFRSVAEIYGVHTLAVIMTGMGQDGLKGCEAVHKVGGRIFVQDEASSVVWGMPGFVAKAGLAEKIIPLDQLANTIVNTVK